MVLVLMLCCAAAVAANDKCNAPLELSLNEHLDGWDYSPNQIEFRFVVAGDLHFGRQSSDISYKMHTQDMVDWMNAESNARGLDVLFLNGDIVHDDVKFYKPLQDEYLSQLTMPFYAIRGNHDYLGDDLTWEDVWGYTENHVVEKGGISFVLANTSKFDGAYSAVNTEWLAETLGQLESRSVVFLIMHIAQRARGVTVDGYTWPQYGVRDRGHGEVEAGEANMKIMESHENVKAIFHSHNHRKIERYMSGGKPYFFCGRLSGSLLRGDMRRGYRVVEVYDSGAIATYYWNAENQVILNAHWVSREN